MSTITPTITACHDCGLTQELPKMHEGSKAICSRCGSVLFRKTHDTIQRTLALSIAGLLLFAIANAYPFLSMQVEGRVQETTLATGIIWLFNNGMQGLSALVLFTSIIVPLIQLLALVYLLTPMLRGRLAPATGTIFRWIRHVMPWSMMEVFLLGILISMIKLSKMATIVPGTAMWAYSGLICILMATFSGLNPHDIWSRLPVRKAEHSEGATHVVTCHSCSLMSTIPEEHHAACPRCGAKLHLRKPHSVQRTTALVIAAILLYLPANLLPITITQVFGTTQSDTIMSGVIFFMFSGSWHIAMVIFIASILIPLLKLITLVYLLISVKFRHQWKPATRTRMYRITEAVGRWSMVDVYVVTVLVALVQLDPFAAIKAGPGAVYFAAVVVVTMFAAESFDARLIWDQKEYYMTEEITPAPSAELPQATICEKKSLSFFWIVPLVALIVGMGLVYTSIMEKGPTVTVIFASAEGLEAGKTKVKYKDVEVGKVEAVELTEDFEHVEVTVSLVKKADAYLNDQTRFWVVRPRLSGGTVTGLGTLLSGAHIAIDPGKEGASQDTFTGLEIPPVVTEDTPGKLFVLKADDLGSLDYGSPIYYRGISIGQVVGYALQEGGEGVDVKIFIDAPYDTYVKGSSRFWQASGIDLEMGADGIRFDSDSLVSILIGGISLSNADHMKHTPLADAGDIFQLFPTRTAAMTKQFVQKEYYLLKFAQSVRGLSLGAPVEFKGFPIGRVVDIGIEFNLDSGEVLVPVRIEVESERLNGIATAKGDTDNEDVLNLLVGKGLRGQVRTGNLLTGKLFVALDFFKNVEPAKLVVVNGVTQIPTTPTPIEELTSNMSALLEKLQKVPMEEIGNSAVEALRSIKETSQKLEAIAGSKDLQLAFQKTRETMEGANALLAKDSATVVELQRALRDMSEAARAIRGLADQLERHPESLIRGKGNE